MAVRIWCAGIALAANQPKQAQSAEQYSNLCCPADKVFTLAVIFAAISRFLAWSLPAREMWIRYFFMVSLGGLSVLSIATDQVVAVESRFFRADQVCTRWHVEAREVVGLETRTFGLPALLQLVGWAE